MSENTTGPEGRSADSEGTSPVRDRWRRFVRWLAGVNTWYVLGAGFALGFTADWAGYHSIDWLFFLAGGVLPIVLQTVPTDEQVDDNLYDVSRRERGRFVLSMLVWSITPWGILTQILQIGGNFAPYLRYRGRLPNRDRHVPDTDVTAPFDGEWTAVNGGVTEETSHSWGLVSQRYAYDFVVTEDGSTHRRSGDDLTDYYAFGEPIRAPARGTVVKTKDSLRDYPKPGGGRTEWRTWEIAGNHVIIEHADDEYSMLAHLQEDSVTVDPGDEVRRGDVVGACGNSGNSSEPHLHYQLMDRRNFWTAAGLVPAFVDVDVSRDGAQWSGHDVYDSVGDSDGDGRRYLVAGDAVSPADDRERC